MANMFHFAAGGGNQSYTYPPAQQGQQQQQYGAYQPYQQQGQPTTNSQPQQQYGHAQVQPAYPVPGQTHYGTAPQNPYSGHAAWPPQQSSVVPPQPNQTPFPQPPFQHPRKHSAPTADAGGCYNCGQYGHIAQHCLEPRRTVPAGSLAQKPPKRQKIGGPVITRYPPPPGYTGPSPQRGYTYPSVGHQPHYPTSSAVQPPPRPFGQPYSPLHQQPYPNHYPAPQPTPSVSWPTHNVPTPINSYSTYFSSPTPVNPPPTSQSFFPPQTQSASPIGYGNSFHSSPQPLGNQPFTSTPGSQHAITPGSVATAPNNDEDLIGTKTAGEPETDPWLEELIALDDAYNEKPGKGPRVTHPPNPVARPLPSTCEEAESIGRLPIAASLAPGAPVSLYFRAITDKDIETTVRATSDWGALKDDPIFADLSVESDFVSIQELIALREDAFQPQEEEVEADEGEEVDIDERNFDDEKTSSDSEANTRSPEDDEDLHPDAFEIRKEVEDPVDSERERRLAELGVMPRADYERSPGHSHRSGDEEVSDDKMKLSNGERRREESEQRRSRPGLSHRDYPHGRNRRDSYRHVRHPDRGHQHDRYEYNHGQRTGWSRPPPPPPPPPGSQPQAGLHPSPHHRSPVYLIDETQISTNGGGIVTSTENADGDVEIDPNTLSPAWGDQDDHSVESKNGREGTEDEDTGPKRQREQFPRTKQQQQQPVVAAAYNRRW